MVFHLVDGVRASGVEMIYEMDFVRYVIQEIHAFVILIRILSIALPILITLHTPHTRLTHVIHVETILILVMNVRLKHRDEIKIDELKGNFKRMSFEINKKGKLQQLEQVANVSTYPSKHFNSFSYDDDDDEDYTIAITPDFLITDSLIMENEHLDTISEMESDEFKSLVLRTLSRSQVSPRIFLISKVNVMCLIMMILKRKNFQRFSILSSTIQPLVMTSQVMRRPRFYSENNRFDTKSYLLELLLNCDTLIASSTKFDSLLEKFFGELAHTDLNPLGINEANCDPEEDIHLVERLLYDNSSPRPPKDFNSKNSDVIIESFSPFPIPVEDKDPFIEEIDLFLSFDGSIPPSIDSDYSDSKGDNLFLERLFYDDPIPLLDILDFSNVV
nr:hypothetical protein [Tanacetum cinerariifolium]